LMDLRFAAIEQAEFAIGFGGGEFDHRQRVDDRHRHSVMTDAEVAPGTFGLRPPIAIGGDVDRPKTVGLGAGGRR